MSSDKAATKTKTARTSGPSVRVGWFGEITGHEKKGRKAVADRDAAIISEAEKLMTRNGATVNNVASALTLTSRKQAIAALKKKGHNVGDGNSKLPTGWEDGLPDDCQDIVRAVKSIKVRLSIWKRGRANDYDMSAVVKGTVGAFTELDNATRKAPSTTPKAAKAPKNVADANRRIKAAYADIALCTSTLTAIQASKAIARGMLRVLDKTGTKLTAK